MRLLGKYITFIAISFNPRICKRCDIRGYSGMAVKRVSIHASVKDATLDENEEGSDTKFQSTHL